MKLDVNYLDPPDVEDRQQDPEALAEAYNRLAPILQKLGLPAGTYSARDMQAPPTNPSPLAQDLGYSSIGKPNSIDDLIRMSNDPADLRGTIKPQPGQTDLPVSRPKYPKANEVKKRDKGEF